MRSRLRWCSLAFVSGETFHPNIGRLAKLPIISYWVDFGFSYVEPSSAAWRTPIALQLVFAFIVLGFILVMPESPRWLLVHDRYEEAADVISAVYDLPPDDPLVADQLRAINAVRSVADKTQLKELFIQGPLKTRTRTSLAVTLQALSQFTGINIITVGSLSNVHRILS